MDKDALRKHINHQQNQVVKLVAKRDKAPAGSRERAKLRQQVVNLQADIKHNATILGRIN